MANYYSIKTKDANSVNRILDKGSGIELDGLNVLQEAMVVGQMVFLVLGGDKPAWDTGLIGIGRISEEPYDVGYSGKNYKVKVDVVILLDRTLKREDFLAYRDTYGTIGIGPITKWEPNQALSQVQEKNAIALMRAMLELCPASKQEFDEFLSDEEKAKVYSPTTKMIEVPFEYGQTQEQAIKMFVEKNNDDFEERNKKMFREWMTKQVKPEGDSDAGNPYAESSVNAYVDVVSRQMIILGGQEKSLFATVDFDTA